tara:strand:+ start:307 stop:597 length:291 start_codon:yes stop_codon:yes gene_type:complete
MIFLMLRSISLSIQTPHKMRLRLQMGKKQLLLLPKKKLKGVRRPKKKALKPEKLKFRLLLLLKSNSKFINGHKKWLYTLLTLLMEASCALNLPLRP